MSEPGALHGIVHVVDDDRAFRTAIGRLLRAAGHDPRLHASAHEYLAADDSAGPACLVLDLRMPGSTGLELQQLLRERGDAHPVIFLSAHGDVGTTVRAMQDGALTFLTKPVQERELLDSVAQALERDAERQAHRAHLGVIRRRYESLTPRERQVMAGVVAGLLNKQISYALNSAERTVKTHRSRVMEKMMVRTVPDLVHVAKELEDAGEALAAAPGA
jgi:FixJ family two-component response regulator